MVIAGDSEEEMLGAERVARVYELASECREA